MKRMVFFCTLILLGLKAFCQNDCNDIEKTVDELHGKTTYMGTIPDSYPAITITKISDVRGSYFAMVFLSWDKHLDLNKSGIFIKFSDGSILRLPNQKVHAGNQLGSLGYTYTTSLKITTKNFKRLTSKYMVQFEISDIKKEDISKDSAIKYMHYIECIKRQSGGI